MHGGFSGLCPLASLSVGLPSGFGQMAAAWQSCVHCPRAARASASSWLHAGSRDSVVQGSESGYRELSPLPLTVSSRRILRLCFMGQSRTHVHLEPAAKGKALETELMWVCAVPRAVPCCSPCSTPRGQPVWPLHAAPHWRRR